MVKIQIVTPKLEDSDEIFNLVNRNRSELKRWLPWVRLMKSSADETNFLRGSLKDSTKLTFGIIINQNFVGMIDLHEIKSGTAEVGYWLDKDSVGKGIVSLALKNLEKLSARDYKIRELKIILNMDNQKSMNVAKRNGYQFIEQNGQNLVFKKELEIF
ncbi:GNAT family N-acetyltransferase [Dellaglioa carnosa]|uniref:GNAT family N-acetyltransferase n=1 Tax=Dellaglioa carnosa TaxID=2995136 RepID=A0ABT4JKM5_9LACO|nr:GNAT family protein [Dellaglioa carnosa]MCZ2490921.1 GNAT family N-acetyltransferase [Dellaglioa carnosa]MCZ2493999.1 GNAT family N-acetyltransferase [Dellaglioa carnosa]MDK1730863.1 GNAT family N-acetyltransferase [Dellaglioa carnosa]